MDGDVVDDDGMFWTPQHRSKQYRPSQLAKLHPVEKSKYEFYAKPTKDMILAKGAALKRVRNEVRRKNA